MHGSLFVVVGSNECVEAIDMAGCHRQWCNRVQFLDAFVLEDSGFRNFAQVCKLLQRELVLRKRKLLKIMG